jgi:adenylate kinase
MWSNFLLEHLTGNEHLFLDGTPRSLPEAKILDTAMKFFNRAKPFIIHIDVSREWSTARLTARGRSDDKTQEEINKRLDWFDTDVAPAFAFFDESPDYNYLKINGEQTIEEVFKELTTKISALIQ